MEDSEHYAKSLRHVLTSFEKAKEWHWSDLIKWLKKVEGVVMKWGKAGSVSELTLLAKRLSQCLNPVLPQGLHTNTLQIYDLLLGNKSVGPLDEELLAYSAGLFPFYQYASPQNKLKLLELYLKYYLAYGPHIVFLVSGLVISVLPGLEDQGSPEAVSNIYTLFDGISRIDSECLSSAIWMALLRTPKARIGALMWLSKRREMRSPDPYLVTNALIAGFNDGNVIVQRMTLDLAKSNFPLNSSEMRLESKIALLEAALRLLKKQDFTIMRRIWEWANFSEGTSEQQRELLAILRPALSNLFDFDPVTIESAKVPLDVLKIVLDQESLEPLILETVTVTVVQYLYRTRNTDEICSFVFRRTQEVLEGPRALYVWKSLHDFFLSGCTENRILETVDVIKYTVRTFPMEVTSSDLKPLVTALLQRMDICPEHALTPCLELSCSLLSKVNEKPTNTQFQSFFKQLCEKGNREITQIELGAEICIVLGEMEEKGQWVQCLINLTQAEDVKMGLIGIGKVVKLLGYERYQAILREDVRVSMLRRLWSLVDSPDQGPLCVSLLSAFFKVSKTEFAWFLANSLISQEVGNKVEAIRRFGIFWKIAMERCPDQLGVIFEKGEGVFNMIDHLENESPLVRHSAREWLLDSLPQFSAVLDPIVSILTHKDVSRTLHPSGRFYYTQEYDTRRVLDALRKLRSVLLSGGEEVHTTILSLPLSSRALEAVPGTETGVYVFIVLEITLGFVQGEVAANSRPAFEIDNQSVQSAACEVLELLLHKGNTALGFQAVSRVLDTLCHAIREENSVMQLQLLNLLSLAFFECQLTSCKEKCVKLLGSDQFSTALLRGMHTKDAFLRLHWIDFIEKMTDIVTSHLSHPLLTTYIGSLLHGLCDIIQKAPVKPPLFKGLQAVISKTLSLISKFEVNSIITAKNTSLIDGFMRFLGRDDRKVEESNPFFPIVSIVFKEMDTVLVTCLSCFGPFAGVKVTKKGTLGENLTAVSVDPAMNTIKPLLFPILNTFPGQFLGSLLGLWFKWSRESAENCNLYGLIRLLVDLNTSQTAILMSCCEFIHTELRGKPSPDDLKDLQTAHFVSVLMMSVPKAAGAEEEKELLKAVDAIFSELEGSNKEEMTLWLFDILRIVVERLNTRVISEDKHLKKTFTGWFKGLVEACIRICLEGGKEARFPYPPSVFLLCQTACTLKEAACYVLKAGLYHIAVSLFPTDSASKLLVQLEGPVSMLLRALPQRSVPMDLMSQLLFSLLENSKEYISRLIRKDTLDFLTSPDFFPALNSSLTALDYWKQIIGIVATFCYPRRIDLVSEFFDKLPSGVFVSRENEINHRARALKAATFLIYTGEIDDYAVCKEVLTEQLIDFLKLYDTQLLLPVLFAFRVLLIKSSNAVLEEIWPRLWPHLYTELIPIFSVKNPGKVNLAHKLGALKVIELLSILGMEEFQLYQWMFFYDWMRLKLVPGGEGEGNSSFVPLIVGNFLRDYRHEWPLGTYTGMHAMTINTSTLSRDPTKRQLLITQQTVTEETELQVKAQALVQTVILSNAERCQPDWNSIHQVIKADFLYTGGETD